MDSTKAQGPLAKRTAIEPLIEHGVEKLKHNDDAELELTAKLAAIGPATDMSLCTKGHWVVLQSLAEVCKSLRSETRILPWTLNILRYIDDPDDENWVKTLTTEARAAVQNISLGRTCLNSLHTGQLDLSFLPNIKNVFVESLGLHRRQKQGLLSAAQAKGWHLHFVGDAEICDYGSCVSDDDRYKSEDDDWFEDWAEDSYEGWAEDFYHDWFEEEDEEYWSDDEYE